MRRYACLLCLGSLALAATARAELAAPAPVAQIGIDEQVGTKLPLDARFVSSSGEPTRLGDVIGNGKPALLVLAYNRCSMLCNLVLRGAADLVRASDWRLGEQVSLVTVSIDPKETVHEAARTRQTVLERAGYAASSNQWPFLVGQKPSIDAVADAVGFRYAWDARTEQFAHPAVVFVIDAEGKVQGYLRGIRHEPARVQAILDGTGEPMVSSVAGAVLNCFRFDALGRTYGPWVQRLFQIGAAMVFLVLGVAIALLARRERALKRGGGP